MRAAIRRFRTDRSGAVSVETALLGVLMLLLTGGTLEASLAYHQWNTAQASARIGVRIAATNAPVARDLNTMTGLGGGVSAGDPMPAYSRSCSGASQSCNQGGFDTAAMDAIVYGPDRDGACASTERARRGICDSMDRVRPANVDVTYEGTGLGTAGSPGDPIPVVTVTLRDLTYDFAFLDMIGLDGVTMAPVSASLVAEDLREGR